MSSPMHRYQVLGDVADERESQDRHWGQQDHPNGTGPKVDWAWRFGDRGAAEIEVIAKELCQNRFELHWGSWLDVLLEEVAEAFATADEAELRAELIQVAAVAVAWVEAIDRRRSVAPRVEIYPETGPTLAELDDMDRAIDKWISDPS